MSLESGKKYGFIASMIHFIMPVVAVVLIFSLFMYRLANLTTPSINSSLLDTSLSFATSISFVVITIVGFILFMLAMYRLSNYYVEPSIFKNVLYAFAINITFGLTVWLVLFGYITSIAGQIPSGSISTTALSSFANLIIVLLVVVFIAFILILLCAVLYWRAFNKLAEKSGIESFKTVGLLYLIGSVLCIIGVGIFLVWIAWIYAAMGYRQLKPQPSFASATISTSPPIVTGKIYCSYCGAENVAEAVFCKNCGKPLTTSQVSV